MREGCKEREVRERVMVEGACEGGCDGWVSLRGGRKGYRVHVI